MNGQSNVLIGACALGTSMSKLLAEVERAG